jgi:hypothetical protein
MGVHVDKARTDHESGGINYLACFRRLDTANDCYSLTLKPNISMVPGVASPIDYSASPYYKIEHNFTFSIHSSCLNPEIAPNTDQIINQAKEHPISISPPSFLPSFRADIRLESITVLGVCQFR